jgi:pyruvate dehydrogenase E1 component alpha subunit
MGAKSKAKSAELGLGETEVKDLLHLMLRIRRFEQRARELFSAGEIPGFIHLCLGQESIPAGVVGCLKNSDHITATHRGHGHILAKGAEMGPMMAELMGKENGYCRGKGGSMHISSFDLGVLGANGILGAGQPIAVGAALSAQLRGADEIAVTFFGEGASAQGAVHEAMNLASVWNLPVVFVAEVNGFAELTPYAVHVSVDSLAQRGAAYGIPAEVVDGEDAIEVRLAARRVVEAARSGEGPQMLEIRVRRWTGHFEGDAQRYRDPDELASATERDPIANLAERLTACDLIDQAWVEDCESKIKAEVEAAVAFGRDGAFPLPEEALHHVYANPMGTAGEGR